MTPVADRRLRGRPTRPHALTAALLAGLLVLGACSTTGGRTAQPDGSATADSTPESGSDRPVGPTPDDTTATLAWQSCDGSFECSELVVPLDYDKPDGATLTLALARRPANNPDERLGTIIMNPGGPGGSAIEFVEGMYLPGELMDRFDLLGFDPRGVGRSSPIDCHSHLQAIYDADPTMEDAADKAHYLEVSQAFADECEQKAGDVLPHLGTANVARDMDQVRAALGDEQVNYLGYSYGTSIGQQYARLFPDRVRTMVLDGVVDQTQTGLEAAVGQAGGFHTALDAYLANCDATDCGLQPSAGQAIDQVMAAAEQQPIPAPGADRPATPGVVNLALGQALYAEFLWPVLTRALDDGLDGDGTGLVDLADHYLSRNADGTYANGFEIYFSVSCLDAAWPDDPETVFAAAKAAGKTYPRVGEALVNDYVRCSLWPTDPDPLVPITADLKGLAPVVVISTTGDPATPYQSGVRVAKQIPGAVLITNEGEGHTIFAQGKDCVDDPVAAYFTDETVPEDGLACS